MDLSDYLARRTCAHIMQNVGGNVGSAFRGELFQNSPNGIRTWGGYALGFLDEGQRIRIRLTDSDNELISLERQLPELNVERRYSKVVTKVDVRKEGSELFVDLILRGTQNGTGRTPNKDRLFYAVYNVGVKPVLRTIFELRKR